MPLLLSFLLRRTEKESRTEKEALAFSTSNKRSKRARRRDRKRREKGCPTGLRIAGGSRSADANFEPENIHDV